MAAYSHKCSDCGSEAESWSSNGWTKYYCGGEYNNLTKQKIKSCRHENTLKHMTDLIQECQEDNGSESN